MDDKNALLKAQHAIETLLKEIITLSPRSTGNNWEVVKVQLRFPERAPPVGPFAMPKFWVWFARILDSKALMDTAVCAELIYSKCIFRSVSICRGAQHGYLRSCLGSHGRRGR